MILSLLRRKNRHYFEIMHLNISTGFLIHGETLDNALKFHLFDTLTSAHNTNHEFSKKIELVSQMMNQAQSNNAVVLLAELAVS